MSSRYQLSSTTMEAFLNAHRPTWAACLENRVSKLSQSGSTPSLYHMWKMPISTFATTTISYPVPRLSYSPRYPQPLIPPHLHPWCRRACGLVYRAVLQWNIIEAHHHGPTDHSKDRVGSLGAWEIVLRSSISQVANAGDDDPVKWITGEGTQVSKVLFHRGIS